MTARESPAAWPGFGSHGLSICPQIAGKRDAEGSEPMRRNVGPDPSGRTGSAKIRWPSGRVALAVKASRDHHNVAQRAHGI